MKPIKGFEGLYSTDESGFIFTHRQNKRMKIFVNNSGYECLVLNTGKNRKRFLVHRLIALNYIPNLQGLKEVNHRNGIKRDNRVENLEWVSSSQNKQHAIKLGLMNNKGSNHGLSKLTERKVKTIKRLLKERKISQAEIARRYKVTPMTIVDIKYGVTWIHVN